MLTQRMVISTMFLFSLLSIAIMQAPNDVIAGRVTPHSPSESDEEMLQQCDHAYMHDLIDKLEKAKIQIDRTENGALQLWRAFNVYKFLYAARVIQIPKFKKDEATHRKINNFKAALILLFGLDRIGVEEITSDYQHLKTLEGALKALLLNALSLGGDFENKPTKDQLQQTLDDFFKSGWEKTAQLDMIIDVLAAYLGEVRDSGLKAAATEFSKRSGIPLAKLLP